MTVLGFGIAHPYFSKDIQIAKQLGIDIVKSKPVNKNSTLVGIQYGTDITQLYDSRDNTKKDEILSILEKNSYISYGSDLPKLLTYIRKSLFKLDTSYLADTPKVVIVITNRKPSSEAVNIANSLREDGVKLVVFGVGDKLTGSDLKLINGDKVPSIIFINIDDLEDQEYLKSLKPGNFI